MKRREGRTPPEVSLITETRRHPRCLLSLDRSEVRGVVVLNSLTGTIGEGASGQIGKDFLPLHCIEAVLDAARDINAVLGEMLLDGLPVSLTLDPDTEENRVVRQIIVLTKLSQIIIVHIVHRHTRLIDDHDVTVLTFLLRLIVLYTTSTEKIGANRQGFLLRNFVPRGCSNINIVTHTLLPSFVVVGSSPTVVSRQVSSGGVIALKIVASPSVMASLSGKFGAGTLMSSSGRGIVRMTRSILSPPLCFSSMMSVVGKC